jgi:ComF family protein
MIFKNIYTLFLNIVFPPLCLICGKYVEKFQKNPVCPECYNRIIVLRYADRVGRLTIRAATDYRDKNIKKLIRLLKYKDVKIAAETLGRLLAERISRAEPMPPETIIVPIPLHPSKEKQRGYNQSKLIANIVGKILNIQVAPDVLRRIKKGNAQMGIDDYDERAENIRGSFAAGRDNGLAKGKTVLLVDDVLTSGSTMREAMREIIKMKPKRIIPAVVARAK